MTRLQDLYDHGGQSPWLDNLNRAYLTSGHLADLVSSGVRGLTSNPTIMAKAIAASSDYDEEFSAALADGQTVDEAYWDLVIADVTGALGVLRRVYDESDGGDGFVSIEVSPRLAHDTNATIESARQLHERIDQPNLFVKIPATREGLGAIEALIGEGRSINVTLIFSLERYREVIEAYLSGLEELPGKADATCPRSRRWRPSSSAVWTPRSTAASSRSPRQDTGYPTGALALGLCGKAAVAQARLAYEAYLELFTGPRWAALEKAGARPQRPLWASTSTKNPAYPDLVYVDTLIAHNTVNTMPEDTLNHFLDHGNLQLISDADFARGLSDLREPGRVRDRHGRRRGGARDRGRRCLCGILR